MPNQSVSNNKQIAKNVAALYFRMIVTMLVGLYTSRVILNALGVEDYGIYNVVGGFVSMFGLISHSLQGAIGRFITFELGRGNREKLKRIFSTSLLVMLGLSVIIVLLTETFGIWYLNNKMVIPDGRMNAAFWCFQLSVFTFVMAMINSPYSSAIIAHERMDMYAYLTILDVVLKLLICFAVLHSPIDRLIFYAILLAVWSVLNQIIYIVFCKKRFEECTVGYSFDRSLFKEMFSFAGWSFIGSSAAILRTQGANLLLNWAGGPVVNAANGVANTVSSMASGFLGNFTQAFNPQITKRYASGEFESLMILIIYGSKFSYYLMWIVALPIILNTDYILYLWLGQVPEHTVGFIRWTMVFLLAESISKPIITAKNANGNIKVYQIVVGGVLLLMLPLSYLAIKMGLPVESVAACNAVTAILAVLARMYMLRGDFPCWSSRVFIKKVIMNAFMVSLVSSILPYIIYRVLPDGFFNLIVTTIISIISVSLSVLLIGLNKNERELLLGKCRLYFRSHNIRNKKI